MTLNVEGEVKYFLDTSGKTVVLDTNVFLLFIIGNTDKNLIKKIGHVNSYSERDYLTLVKLLNNFEKYIVTPNILTEISNLIGGEDHHHKEKIFKETLKILSKKEFEEKFIESLVILKDPSVYHFGVTDVGITKLKINHYGVITADDQLCKELMIRNIPTLNFKDLKLLS